jgi:hypothetical protein
VVSRCVASGSSQFRFGHTREFSDKPIESAFCRIAPTVLFILFPIFAAGVFFRASDLSSRTCTDVQGRLFVPFFIYQSPIVEKRIIVAGSLSEGKSGFD